MTTASAAIPADVTPLSFTLGILAFVALVALIGAAAGAARYLRAAHARGMARLHVADQTTAARREAERARHLRRVRRTVVTIDPSTGAVRNVTIARPGR